MLYFKHLSTAQKDENMAIVIDEFGWWGYGLYWAIIELIAEQMVGDDILKTWIEYPWSEWKRKTGVTRKRLEPFFMFLSEKNNFFSEKNGKKEKKIEKKIFSVKFSEKGALVDCPNILKIKDEYTRKKTKISG